VILEHALLPVRPGEEDALEAAFAEAMPIIASMRGFECLSLTRCVERPSTYLLLVEWQSLDDHTVGFRTSPAYDDWRALLHHFYEPFPTVEHFQPVHDVRRR
jgi:heme-degrading monooxygenase HmoA